MATTTLTSTEIISVRRQISLRLTPSELSDDEINDPHTIESACDYVFEEVIRDIDLTKLTDAERLIAERVRDETSEDLAMFESDVLKPPQRRQFRRAIVYHIAGLIAPTVPLTLSEAAGGISQNFLSQQIEQKQLYLFSQADLEIQRLRNAFPNDAFPDAPQASIKPLLTLNLFRTTNQ